MHAICHVLNTVITYFVGYSYEEKNVLSHACEDSSQKYDRYSDKNGCV